VRLIIALAVMCVIGAAVYAVSRVHMMGPWAAAADGARTSTCRRCAGPLTVACIPAQPGMWEIRYGEALAAGTGEMRACGADS